MQFKGFKSEKLVEAMTVAEEFASKLKRRGVVGIVFLGGIARGYFDEFSDIDIIIFKESGIRLGMKGKDEIMYKGFKIDYEIINYEYKVRSKWGMTERWAFSKAKIFYDPEGKISDLISKKVYLKDDERRWMMMEGIVQSEWYCNEVSESWIYRGDLMSAHHSINIALEYLMKTLFGLNNQLLPDEKWLMYGVQQLKWLPEGFNDKLREIMLVKDISIEEIQRRRDALNYLWKQMLQRVEEEVGTRFYEIKI